MNKSSYAKIERDLKGEYKKKMNAAESTEDVKKFFGQTALRLFGRVFEGEVAIDYEDVRLDANRPRGFRLREGLTSDETIQKVWDGSDLPDIVGRFATQAGKRMKDLEKHPERTESKIHHRR